MKAFTKFAGYILLKWLLFYIYQIIERGKYETWWDKATNTEGLFLAAFMLSALPIAELLILIIPFQFALKQKGWLATAILVFAFAIEFTIGWYATNQNLELWMIAKIALSIGLFCGLYRQQLQYHR